MIHHYRRFHVVVVAATLMFLGMAGCSESPITAVEIDPTEQLMKQVALIQDGHTGNGAPNGAHFNLNIIGVPKQKSASMDGNNGHRIFVNLFGKNRIYLLEGDEFRVLDANGTDGRAEFQLPNPGFDETNLTTEYAVYARPLGKPGGSASLVTCAEDPNIVDDPTTEENEAEVCATGDYVKVFERKNGRSSFEEVSKQLLTLGLIVSSVDNPDLFECLTGVDPTTLDQEQIETTQVGLFDACLQNYFWSYDNNGLKLLQLRFYPVLGDVS